MAKNNLKNLWNKVKKALSGSSTSKKSSSSKKTTRPVSTYSPKEMSEYNKKRQASSSSSKKTTSTKKNNKKTNEAPIRTRTSSEYSSVNNNAMASRKLIQEIETKTKASDIAPVKKKEKTDDEKWFKKGAFEDGYEFGDVTKTVASTVGDAGLNIVKGVGSLGEGLLDLGRYGVAELGESLGAENFANRQRVKARENSIDNFFKDVETGVDQWSILGGKSDAVMQGLGQVGGIILTGGIGAGAGLTTAGATALTTGMIGASSMGSGMSEAYQNKATDEEAWKYGAIKGVVDAGSELIFGGLGKTVKAVGLSKGLTSLDDAFAQKLSSKISNQFMKNLTEYGVKSSAEGLEEVLAGLGSAVGKKLTYASEEELNELIKDENLLDQFVVGAVTSGIAQSGLVPGMSQGSLKEANKTGRDFITGYTQNEQKVVDKVVESRIAEQEADGKKLTNKEKGKIAEEVEEELKKGYIDIDTIESTLGGETYKNYKSAVDNEAKLQEEYDTLHKMERGKMTGEQIDRETELKSQLDELKNNSKTSQMREQLDFEISKLTEKDTLLRESYNERSRRGQSFEADLTKYDAKQQEVIKKATESGILNNTNRTHEFVDMVAKISADKGVSFDFTSNEKLKESGFAIDGKTINGYIKDGNIAVNINSNKALNTVVGHEITHVLEGTELYTELQNAVKEYATTKGDYDTRYKALQGLYKDVDSAVIENEITADLVGDYLFTDADFVNRLSAEKPNVFKKIYDEIKYLVKTVTGTKESRELAKVQKLFEDAYKNSNSTKSDISTKTTAEAKTLNEVDMEYDAKTETVAYSLSSLEEAFKYNESEVEYKNAREDYVQALMKSIGDTSEDGRKKAENYLNSMFLVHDMIARDRDRLDYESAEGKSAWVGNSEYGGSIDFSTLCAKRRLFTGTFDAIQNALPDTVLTDKDYLEIRNLLLEHNQEAPCSMCYVEGSRAKHGTYVKKFLNDYLKTNPAWKPQIADFTSTTRLEQTRIQHPEAYAEYVKAMNKLSQRKPKEASVRTDYKGEILKSFKDGESVEQKNLNGGVRFNSFSDFEIIHTLDAMQVITDMARVGLNGQAYTKVKEFAECFGNTGMKINLSLVAKDVDADGNLVYDEVNGMKHSEAIDLRNRYSDNVGTVIVVFNEAQMKSALANPEIDFVLPFHRSQWRKSQYTMMGLPIQTKDFTNVQNDRFRNPKTGRPKKVADGNIMPNEYWDFTKSGRENAQIYLDYINENNYIPKFDSVLEKVDGKYVLPEGAVGDGYFKLLIDFKMYNNDGVGIPQSPVMPEFNMPYIQQMLEDYKGGHHSFPVAHDVVEDFLKTKKGSKDIAPVKDNGVQYSLSDSDGKKLTKEQGEYFKDSKVRDENGNLKVMYHGSESAGFHKFLIADDGQSYFFTDDNTVAKGYSGTHENYIARTFHTAEDINNFLEEVGQDDYEVREENGKFVLYDDGDNVAESDTAKGIYEEFQDWTGLGTGSANYKTYLNIKNPLVVDAKNNNWDELDLSEFTGESSEYFNNTREFSKYAKENGYDGVIFKNIIDTGLYASGVERFTPSTVAVVFDSNQIKSVANQKPTSDADIRYSLSEDNDYAPLTEAQANERDAQQRDGLYALNENDMPPEFDAPYYEELDTAPVNPFDKRDIDDVGKRNVKAYMYENPEVKPFFREEAQIMLRELQDSTKGEKQFNSQLYYETGGEQGWFGTKRQTSEEVAYLLDRFNYTYADIEKGLKAIIEDHGAENNAVSKRIEFMIDERLREGYTDFTSGYDIPNNPDYIDLLKNKNITEYTDEAYNNWLQSLADEEPNDVGMVEDIAPVRAESIKPRPEVLEGEEAEMTNNPIVRADSTETKSKTKQRKWVKTSTESEAVNKKIVPEDLDQNAINYQPIHNKKTLGIANSRLDNMGYDTAVSYFKGQFTNRDVKLEDVALGERLIQEAMKREDYDTARELIQDVSILGTELGQKVQALSIIQRLTPEGQLRTLRRTIERARTKGDKAFDGVELTPEMEEKILRARKKDGTFDQKELTQSVEDVKQELADQMKVTATEKINAWRYLSMLGNPKTHIRNLVSNIAMKGTLSVKNAVARTVEEIAPVKNRTKTWKSSSEDVKAYAKEMALEYRKTLADGSKYNDTTGLKEKRDIFKNKILNGMYEFNSNLLQKEDWWFSTPAFEKSFREFLTANGIETKHDIAENIELVNKAKAYATEQAQIATFQQYSWLANKIGEMERKNALTNMAVGSVLPFKKTPINIAKTGLNYSPLGFAKTLTYDIAEVKKGNMEASTLVDHLAQNTTGTALTLIGYMLAMSGILNGSGDDDKEGTYDYQLGKQSYSINIGDSSFSLSWLTPVAMPLFVGANAYEQLVEGQEWNGDVVVETLAQTLDPLSEMSFLSSLDSVLSSYDSGIQKFAGIGETAFQNYATQFIPTLSSQLASTMDDTKRSTKVSGDSGFKMFDETLNKLKYKIPGLRETLEPTTDIWGNEVKQTENLFGRAFENFIAPYSRKEYIATSIDEELKDLYSETGEDGLLPSIPYNYLNYNGEKYKMSADEYTLYKKRYGQIANDMLDDLFRTSTYQSASSEERAEMVEHVYDYSREDATKKYLARKGVEFTNATKDGVEYYREDAITTVINEDIPLDEANFKIKNPEKYDFLKHNNITYTQYKVSKQDESTARMYDWAYENPEYYQVARAISSDLSVYWKHNGYMYNNIRADKDANGKSISGSKKRKIIEYLNSAYDLTLEEKMILFKKYYPSDDTYNYEIVDYLNSRDDMTYEEKKMVLVELDFKVDEQGNITW